MAMIKIGIYGFYGEGNLGDEAVLQALLQEIRNFPKIKPTVFSSKPEEVVKVHQATSISLHSINFPGRIREIVSNRLFILGGGGLLKEYGDSPYKNLICC